MHPFFKKTLARRLVVNFPVDEIESGTQAKTVNTLQPKAPLISAGNFRVIKSFLRTVFFI